jgi:hypothetical protein
MDVPALVQHYSKYIDIPVASRNCIEIYMLMTASILSACLVRLSSSYFVARESEL